MNTLTPSTLYILLQSRSTPSTFHWSLYTTNTHGPLTRGTKHDLTDEKAPRRIWSYNSAPANLLELQSQPVIAAVKVDVIDDVEMLRGALEDCRVWVKEALWGLDQGGFIDLGDRGNVSGIQGVEMEVVRAGLVAMWRGVFGVYELGEDGFGVREVG
ncbi:hypothetical protein BDV41DRAFT_566879 [Aspergillus transmontanensis]|uniref:Uncharacterized protein n=1 Tax=Aspergillus transmontanensis TaxID=1034304 RepID=A0A5N6VNF4_9EURO|nr:hypothetical protein BDV41DRAFT_566879 [Aspergillus transmontanensis]